MLVPALSLPPGAFAASSAYDVIHSPGPLREIDVGRGLSCQTAHTLDASTEFYPGVEDIGDCGTFLAVTGGAVTQRLFGAGFTAHTGGTHTGFPSADYKVFTDVSQTPVTGVGTAADPYQVTTVVNASETGVDVTLTQVDSYVTGDDNYTSAVTVANAADSSAFSGQLLHAGDCFLHGSNDGFGALAGGAAACSLIPNGSQASGIEEFVPARPALRG